MTAQLLEGSAAIGEAMIAAGCRFFAGYPMTPFTEVLEHMAKRLPEVGGVCMNAERSSRRSGWRGVRLSTGTRAATGSTGQGLSLMQESIAEAAIAQVPLVVLNMARAQGDYFQATRGGGHGDYRTPVLAPMDVAEATVLVQRAFHLADRWRNPVLLFGDYYIAHTYSSVDVEPVDLGALPRRTGRSTAPRAAPAGAAGVPLGDTKQRDDVGYDLADFYVRAAAKTAAMVEGIERLADVGWCDDADLVVVGLRHAGKYVRYAVASSATRATGSGTSGRSPCSRSPTRRCGRRPRAPRLVAVYENNQGQMVDDVRLALEGSVPTRFIGRLSLDSSGFGIAPDYDVDVLRVGSPACWPSWEERMTVRIEFVEGRRVLSTNGAADGARLVDDFTAVADRRRRAPPVPGCGEPIAIRSILETRGARA
jgi:2-oxoglutarate/2-oxoacid ferredoxin oxidoreductase subunit alpha